MNTNSYEQYWLVYASQISWQVHSKSNWVDFEAHGGSPATLLAWVECESCGRIDKPDHEFDYPGDSGGGRRAICTCTLTTGGEASPPADDCAATGIRSRSVAVEQCWGPMPTESQLRDAELRRRIGQLIDSGRLPCMIPASILGGYGSGKRCTACDQPITPSQIEYETHTESRRLNLHLGCHVLWQLECQTRLKATGAIAS